MTQSLQITPQVLAATCRRNGYRSVDIAAELGISVERVQAAAARIFVELDRQPTKPSVTEEVAHMMYDRGGRLYG